MALLITPEFTIPFHDADFAKSVPFDDFTKKIIKIIHDWRDGRPFIMHTSGSTGTPKEIMLNRDAMKASVLQSAEAFGLGKGSTLLCCLSTEHIAGLMMVIRALVLDADLIAIPPSSNPMQELPAPPRHIDLAAFVPVQLDNTLSHPAFNNTGSVIVGGAPVSETLSNRIKGIAIPVYQTYGMTETYTHVALRKLSGQDAGEAYFALNGISFSTDDRGCLVIHAPALGQPSLITNDVVSLIDKQHFIWHGRYDNIINSGGIKVQLEKIEKAAEAAFFKLGQGTLTCFATDIPDEKFGQRPVLVVEGSEWAESFRKNFMDLISRELSRYEMPVQYFFTREFTRTALGKTDRLNTMKEINNAMA